MPLPASSARSTSAWADSVGSTGAFLCAIHCALLPVAIAALPLIGLSVFASDGFDRGFLAFAFVLGVGNLWRGFRKHRATRAIAWLIPGLIAIATGVLVVGHQSPGLHAGLMTSGGLMIAVAHVTNMRLIHQSKESLADRPGKGRNLMPLA